MQTNQYFNFNEQCQDVHHAVDKCLFVQNNFDCNNTLSIIDYTAFMYCGFEEHHIPLAIGICVCLK